MYLTWSSVLEIQILYLVMLLFFWIQCAGTQFWRFEYPLLVLIFYYSFDIYKNFKNYKKTFIVGDPYLNSIERSKNSQGTEIEMHVLIRLRRKILKRNAFEDAILALTWVFIMFCSTELLPIPSYVWVAPLLIAILSKFLCQSWPKSPCEGGFHLISIFGSISRIFVLGFVFAKLDNLINWSWGGVLWGWWLTFTVLIITSLFWVILFLNSVFSYFQDEVGYQAVVGSFWLIFLFAGYAITNFISCLYIIQ